MDAKIKPLIRIKKDIMEQNVFMNYKMSEYLEINNLARILIFQVKKKHCILLDEVRKSKKEIT